MSGTKPIRLKTDKKNYLWGTEEWFLAEAPLLIKKITAREPLSVQVHPDDRYAKEKEGCSGKTEMWYILDAEPGAFLYYGLKHKISANEFLKRIDNHTITEACRKVRVKKGDVFYIPAGLLHAIGGRITVLEIQQNSNVTYRVYDYDRRDADQKPRQLHIEQAARVAGFLPPLQGHRPMGLPVETKGAVRMLLVQCAYFTVSHYQILQRLRECVKKSFTALYVIEGEGMMYAAEGQMPLKKGDCICLPKQISQYEVVGKLEYIKSEAAE